MCFTPSQVDPRSCTDTGAVPTASRFLKTHHEPSICRGYLTCSPSGDDGGRGGGTRCPSSHRPRIRVGRLRTRTPWTRSIPCYPRTRGGCPNIRPDRVTTRDPPRTTCGSQMWPLRRQAITLMTKIFMTRPCRATK